MTMDDPSDFKYKEAEAKFKVGDLVSFTGYHYSPDFKYIDEDDYDMGVVVAVHERTYYAPVYTVHWFKHKRVTDVIQEHLSMVVKELDDYL